jgi:hypothetical protein
MKTKILGISGILLMVMSTINVMGQSGSFSGDWKLNKSKSMIQNSQLFLSRINVIQKSDSLLTTRVYENEYGEEYPFKENLSLNGKECKIVIYDMPRKSIASFSASERSIHIESTTTFYGNNGTDDLKSKETWKTENGGKTLSILFTTTYSGGTLNGTHYFDRIK